VPEHLVRDFGALAPPGGGVALVLVSLTYADCGVAITLAEG
jgi:hypothetical protein